jgi:uncharacterized damage-inducible protein DinB
MRVSDLARVYDYNDWANSKLCGVVAQLTPEQFTQHEDLTRDITFAIGGGPTHAVPLGDLLLHAALHAVHHRGQVALLLRTLGYVPGNFDLLIYAGEGR